MHAASEKVMPNKSASKKAATTLTHFGGLLEAKLENPRFCQKA
jgi:hypothetical protein